jgi:hypothetical protein
MLQHLLVDKTFQQLLLQEYLHPHMHYQLALLLEEMPLFLRVLILKDIFYFIEQLVS